MLLYATPSPTKTKIKIVVLKDVPHPTHLLSKTMLRPDNGILILYIASPYSGLSNVFYLKSNGNSQVRPMYFSVLKLRVTASFYNFCAV